MKDSSIVRRFNQAFKYDTKYKLITTLLRLMDRLPECDKPEFREFCIKILADGNTKIDRQTYVEDRHRLRKIIV